MAFPYNSGTGGYGSQVWTIGGVAYVAEGISFSEPTARIERRNELNVPSDLILTPDFGTGSATLQLATATTVLPGLGVEYEANLIREAASGTQTYVLDGRSQAFEQAGMHKVSVTFTAKP